MNSDTVSKLVESSLDTASSEHPDSFQIYSDNDDYKAYQNYLQTQRRSDVERGSKSVIQMEQLADSTWRPLVPIRDREKFMRKVGPLKSRQSATWSNPSPSPRNGASSSMSVATFAGVTDPHYLSDLQRRLMYDRFKHHFRENTNIFPTQDDIAKASEEPPHSPRAVSYVPVLVHMPVSVKPHKLKPLKQNNSNSKVFAEAERSSPVKTKKETKLKGAKGDRRGPTQYQTNTGLVMVMKPDHALAGTVYEDRMIEEDYKKLMNFRLDHTKLKRENTKELLDRCDRLMDPVKAEKKRKKRETIITPTDWHRTISATPNLNDLVSELPNSPDLARKIQLKKKSKKPTTVVSKPLTLEQIMKPDGKPKFYVDSVSKCVTWLNKNFS